MSANKKWKNQFQLWKNKQVPDENILRLLRRYRTIELDLEIIRSSLSSIHQHIDPQYLEPFLLPETLLLHPDQWKPTDNKIHELACLSHHANLNDLKDLVKSEVLNKILAGHISLYADLPPIPIKAYFESLKRSQRQFCKQQKISALEHLAQRGWHRFRTCQEVAIGLDRYQAKTLAKVDQELLLSDDALVVLESDEHQAHCLALQGGWDRVYWGQLDQLFSLRSAIKKSELQRITICHGKDELAQGARYALHRALRSIPPDAILTTDDIVCWGKYNDQSVNNRQYRSAISPFRLLSRGGIGGLLSLPASLLLSEMLQDNYKSLYGLKLDLALLGCQNRFAFHHCNEALVRSYSHVNPSILEQGWPGEHNVFTDEQINEFTTLKRNYASSNFQKFSRLDINRLHPFCHDLRVKPQKNDFISILIPFRDKVELTKACVHSIQRYAGDEFTYEIILIDNGSQDKKTAEWIEEITRASNITCYRMEAPFNFARLNNKARKYCQGSHLLFLNNDIEFCSNNVLNVLMDPFAHPNTSAVGAKLLYPDGSIQHQGVVIVKGERRCVLEPGKNLKQLEVVNSLVPLTTQEEFSAASAACLLVKADCFDAVGGFDEDFAVVFNDVDLCLRLRKAGGTIVVTPHARIIHHESVSRGKDLEGKAWARHQRESGLLRRKHQDCYRHGDALVSPHLNHHSTRYEPASPPPRALGPVREQILLSWRRSVQRRDKRPVLIFAQYGAETSTSVRPDILALLKEYRKHFYVVVVAATPSLLENERNLNRLKRASDGLIVRRNEGYDYGSWMAGLRAYKPLILQRGQLLLSNDSFWGPVRPIDKLLMKLSDTTADVVGLTDNLMYEPHLQSPFLLFREKVINNPVFWDFWDDIKRWETKRSIIKNYEVGLPVLLRKQGMRLESLYCHNSNGNIFHAEWKSLITQQGFPFIKVSLLRDNPHGVDIATWQSVVNEYNPWLTRQISAQLTELKDHWDAQGDEQIS